MFYAVIHLKILPIYTTLNFRFLEIVYISNYANNEYRNNKGVAHAVRKEPRKVPIVLIIHSFIQLYWYIKKHQQLASFFR